VARSIRRQAAGDLGAEVIKVESSSHPDEMRAYGGTDINHAPFFLSINPEVPQRGVGRQVRDRRRTAPRLIARSDIVINNLRPGAMERMGLGYEQLKAIKQDIISVSIKIGQRRPLGYQTATRRVSRGVGRGRFHCGYPAGRRWHQHALRDSTVGAAGRGSPPSGAAAPRPDRRRPIRRRVAVKPCRR